MYVYVCVHVYINVCLCVSTQFVHTLRSSCLGIMVITSASTLITLPCKRISCPSHTSTMSPGASVGPVLLSPPLYHYIPYVCIYTSLRICDMCLKLLPFNSTSSGVASNFSDSPSVGLTPSYNCNETS